MRHQRMTFLLAGAAWMLLLASSAQAQAPAQAPGGLSLAYPTGDRATSVLLVESTGPAEVRVGQNYDYQITVRNISKTLTLDDVRIMQDEGDGFSVESSEPSQDDDDNDQGGTWSLGKLGPGDSKTIRVSAVGDKEGEVEHCIRVSYSPALCLRTRFTKPEISVTKEAPEEVSICEPLTFRYLVKNSGSAPVHGVTVNDDLPDGLKTLEGGKKKVAVDVGDLDAGQAKTFAVRICATETGEYASRAVAHGEGDLSARSSRPTTRVIQPKLAVEMNGPTTQYVNQPMTYRVRVRNTGEATATRTRLQVQIDEKARLVRTSQSAPGNVSPKQPDAHTLTWDLGNLDPDQDRVISFSVVSRGAAKMEHVATAASYCEACEDVAPEDRGSVATSKVQAEVLTFPALVLEMVDQNDPIQVGETEVYTISVVNQGTGTDENVQITCKLPGEFEYVNVTGPTEAKADGQTITFGKVDRLGPRQRVTWKLQAKAIKAGDVRNKIELTSDYLGTENPVLEEEPTRLIGEGGEAKPAPGGSKE